MPIPDPVTEAVIVECFSRCQRAASARDDTPSTGYPQQGQIRHPQQTHNSMNSNLLFSSSGPMSNKPGEKEKPTEKYQRKVTTLTRPATTNSSSANTTRNAAENTTEDSTVKHTKSNNPHQ
jgi:hypothetical protein